MAVDAGHLRSTLRRMTRSRVGDLRAGTHLVAADGQQLARCRVGVGVLQWCDPALREWSQDEHHASVAVLCAAAPMLPAERDQARAPARRLWAARRGDADEDDADARTLAGAHERGLTLSWCTRPADPPTSAHE